MPYLRFSRDKRGHENTFVLESRDDGSSTPRLLYWFHTPPNVKVGRAALDEESIRSIEERNPDVAFDWETLLKSRPAPTPEPRGGGKGRSATQRRSRRNGEGRRSGRGRRDGPSEPRAAAPPSQADTPRPVPVADVVVEVDDAHEVDDRRSDGPADGADVSGASPRPELAPASGDVTEPPASVAFDRAHPVVALMGRDTLTRLVTRYTSLLQRISEQSADADRRATWRARAEELDPGRWTTIEAAVAGIERFEREVAAIEDELARQADDVPPPAE